MEKPICDVDILTANYNNGIYIRNFIDSVIDSTILPAKLIIIDDGSKDNSIEIIKEYADKYIFIKLISLKENIGFANALNVGIDHLESKYTLRIDPDDYMTPDRIEVQYNYMIANPTVDILGSNIQYFDSSSMKILFRSNVALSEKRIIEHFRNGSCGLIHGSTMIKTSLLKQFKYCQANVPAEDYEIFSKMITNGAIAHNSPQVLTLVRVHINSVSNFLPYDTIAKSYALAHKIWGTKHSKLAIRIKYLHLKYYRLFLFEPNKIKKIYYIIISSMFAPQKVINRLYNS